MSSGVCIFLGVLLGVGVGDGLGAAVGVGVDTGTFFLGWWGFGSAKETPAKATKTARIAADSTLAFIRKGRRRFSAILVAIIGGFKAEFSRVAVGVGLGYYASGIQAGGE
jgi:Zn-dependent protease